MQKLNDKQSTILKEVKKYIAKNGFPPSIRELCNLTGYNSTATIYYHLNELCDKGYISKGKDKNRAIELLVPNEYGNKKRGITTIPILGYAFAGNFLKNDEIQNEYIDVPNSILDRKKDIYALKVCGNNMIPKGICNNDIIIVKKGETAKDNEIILTMNNKMNITLEIFSQEKKKFKYYTDKIIIGKVIALYRKI